MFTERIEKVREKAMQAKTIKARLEYMFENVIGLSSKSVGELNPIEYQSWLRFLKLSKLNRSNPRIK